ncbi:keratin, type I cytoskeletal 9-like [Liolophura sinensis]|uniref:keratin, type I cytoskeletal 9-like n=1 Tax=Liolophura sinensis TaxID=3198878 RepID=UPI0031594C90
MVLHNPAAGRAAPAAEAVEVETPEVAAGGAGIGMGMTGYGTAGGWGPYSGAMPPPGYQVIYVPVQSYGPPRHYPDRVGAHTGYHNQAPPGLDARYSRPTAGAGSAGAGVGSGLPSAGTGRDASATGVGRSPSRTGAGRRTPGAGVGPGSTRARISRTQGGGAGSTDPAVSGGAPHSVLGGGSPLHGASGGGYPYPPSAGGYHYPPSAGAYHYSPSGGGYPYHVNGGGYPFGGVPGGHYGGGAGMAMDPVVQQLLDIEPVMNAAGTGVANTAQQPTEIERELGAGTHAGLNAFSYGLPSQGMWVPGTGMNRGGAMAGGWV